MRNVERAKRIAADKGVNISFVCREIGKSRGYISQMLTTDRDFPDEMLLPVANALGVTVEELTGEQKEKTSQQPQSEVDAAVERIRKKLESMPTAQREALMNLIEKM
nr:MAG TPA: helix-turn-helix domain protein [Caudoviricetes sp.]